MDVIYKEIEKDLFTKVSDVFNINLTILKNHLKCFGAFLEDEIIGILSLTQEDKGAVRIKYFQILPLFRCNQIGSVLLKLVKEYAVSIHAKKMFVKYNDVESDVEKCSRFFTKNKWDSLKYTHTRFCFKKERFNECFISKFYDTDDKIFNDEIIFISFSELSKEKVNQIKEQSEKILSNGLLPLNVLDSMVKDLSIEDYRMGHVFISTIPKSCVSNFENIFTLDYL